MTFIGLNDGAATMIDIDKMDAVIKVNSEHQTKLLCKSISSDVTYDIDYNDTTSLLYDFDKIKQMREFIKVRNHLIRLEAIEGFAVNDGYEVGENILCVILRGGYLVQITMDKANANAYHEEIRKQLVLM